MPSSWKENLKEGCKSFNLYHILYIWSVNRIELADKQDIGYNGFFKSSQSCYPVRKGNSYTVKLTIFRARLTLSPDLEGVYDLIKQGVPLGSKEIARKLNIHQNTALKRLRWHEEKGLIHKHGSGPRVRYSIWCEIVWEYEIDVR